MSRSDAFLPKTFLAAVQRGQLQRLVWQSTHSSEKREDERGHRYVRCGAIGEVNVDLLSEEQLRALLPPTVAATLKPERAGEGS